MTTTASSVRRLAAACAAAILLLPAALAATPPQSAPAQATVHPLLQQGVLVTESDFSFDETWDRLIEAIESSPASIVQTVDHAQAALDAGLQLPPTRLVIFGNPQLGTPLMQASQTAGIDLPQKILVWQEGDSVLVGYNSVGYLVARHDLGSVSTLEAIRGALVNFTRAATGNQPPAEPQWPRDVLRNPGLVTLESPDGVEETFDRLVAAIEGSPADVVLTFSHDDNAASVGLDLRPTRLVIFGNPQLGTPLMQRRQSIGLDLPLKLLVWEDADGTTRVTYNDVFYLARRHRVSGPRDVLETMEGALETFARAAVGGS